jgi:hypothetical protein
MKPDIDPVLAEKWKLIGGMFGAVQIDKNRSKVLNRKKK